MKIVECVPNFSEGRDLNIINQITDAMKAVDGAHLLDVDPGQATNRTVVTMAGHPDAVVEAAFQGIKKASEVIDMTKHTGEHARAGATDVCPFVPVSDMTMDECVELANKLGKRVGDELGIPVYFYEYAASKPEWRNLAVVRKGEYEALPAKMKDPNWKPDYGPQVFNAKSGATQISAREFLIAYNINLNTRDKKKAHDIALSIREKGRLARDANNKIIKDADGNKVMTPGLFTHCKAVGWYIDEYNQAQISMNLTNYKITPPHLVLEKVRELARAKNIQVTGSELVGLMPLEAVLNAGKYYLEQLGETVGVPESFIVQNCVQSMGLEDIAEFDAEKKIIEYCIDTGDKLVKLSVAGFADELSTDSPAPGGGSVAGVCAAMSGGLSAMVAVLTQGKKYKDVEEEAKKIAPEGQKVKEQAIAVIDEDTDAFNAMMAAARLPKKTEAQQAHRNEQIQLATKNAILIPLKTLKIANEGVKVAEKISKIGNPNALSDAGVAAITANAAAKSAWLNVKINMQGIEDARFIEDIMRQSNALLNETDEIALRVEAAVKAKLD